MAVGQQTATQLGRGHVRFARCLAAIAVIVCVVRCPRVLVCVSGRLALNRIFLGRVRVAVCARIWIQPIWTLTLFWMLSICEQILRLIECRREFLFQLSWSWYVTPNGRYACIFPRYLTRCAQTAPNRLITRLTCWCWSWRFVFGHFLIIFFYNTSPSRCFYSSLNNFFEHNQC